MVFVSAHPDVPLADAPVHATVLAEAAGRGEHPALVDGLTGRTIGYAELVRAVERTAAGFAAAGLRKGDVIALHSPNTIAYPVVFLAASRAGLVVTTLNVLSTVDDIVKQVRDSGARWLVTVSMLLPVATQAAERSGIEEVLVCDTADGHRSVLELPGDAAPEIEFDLRRDLFALPYSSGTTGHPKGVMLSHHNVATNLNQSGAAWHDDGQGERVLAVLPFFHIFGITIMLNYLRKGSTLVVLPSFDLARFLGAIQEHRITRVFAVPPIVLALAKHPDVDGYDTSSVREILCAAAPLDEDLANACARRLGARVLQGYGMTELSPVSHLISDEDRDQPPGCVGRLVSRTEARVVDPVTGADLGVGEVGELWVRGPQVMLGYLGRPEETDATVDADGWLHTGDVATVDGDGYWYIVDRVKELIKYKGYQVAPAELEAVLLSDPRVADAAVIGVYVDGAEVPKAFVVRAPGADLDAEEVMAFVADRVAPYKKVRLVEFIDAVPRALSGKILRRELRKR
ncbi:AMP-binding protein [Allokutzneria oryzae]|uniref:AMP-binding protein n=1 Tax=Allokutzneria oryzae TaxID=1378989 RepID=A0ABV5ZPZ6_9PSEU